MRGDRLQSAKSLGIGKGQTTVGDRLPPSLTTPSMFNAVGQRRGQDWTATLIEEVSPGVGRLGGKTTAILRESDRRQGSVTRGV